MKLIECVNAYMAAVELSQQDLDFKTAYALVRLKKKLQTQFDFIAKEEAKLTEEYADRDENGEIIWKGPGKFQIRDIKRVEEYSKRREELGDMDVQEEFTPWRAPVPKSIKPANLEALEGFIVFEEES